MATVSATCEESFFEEVVDNGKKRFRCSICFRLLSRKQRVQAHLTSVHGKGPFKKTYKRYIDDPSIAVPRSTKHNQFKRLKTFSPTYASLQGFDTCTIFNIEPQESISSELASSCEFYAEGPSFEITNEGGLRPGTEIIQESGNVSDDDDDDSSTASSTGESIYADTEDELTTSDDEQSENTVASEFSDQQNICMAVQSFVMRHHVTAEAAKDLIDLVKVTCPESATFQSLSYNKVQEVCGNCDFVVHDICEKCFRRFPPQEPESCCCTTNGCDGLRYKGSRQQQWKKCHKNSFVTANMHNQLRDLLERKGVWKTIQQRIECRGKQDITDITDGHYYGKLCEEGGFLSDKSNISLIFNTDGAPLYSSSNVSLWPVFLAVNELPSPDRFSKQNMLMWGIWQGKGKPPFNVYFEPFASEMIDLYQNGLQISLPNEPPVNVKVAVLLGSADLQGKAYLMNMTQHNGESGCLTCEEPGMVVKQGKGHARFYPYKAPTEAAPKRTRETFLANALEAHQSRKKVAGVIDVTSLALMPWFDLVLGMVPDYMHGCLLGITKSLLYKWLSPTNHKEAHFIGGEVAKINKRVLQMKPPDFLVRLPRDIEKHFKNLKASELQAWLLYYGLPCLVGYLPDKYLQHFAHLAEGIYILLGDSISHEMLARAQDLLMKFYRDFHGLYGSSGCGLNVHNAGAHLADYVRGWGPLWAWSTFGFEDMNGTIMDFTHGTGNVCRQLIWMLHAQSRLRCEQEFMADGRIKEFMRRMLNTRRELKNLKDARDCKIAGKAKAMTGLSQATIDKINEKVVGDNKMKVARIVMNGQVFFSKEYTRMVKRNACVVLFVNGKVGEVEFFVWSKESGVAAAVYKEIMLDALKPFFFDDAGHHILRMKPTRSDLEVARVESIKEKVFFLDGNEENNCLVRLPNFGGVCG